MSPGPAPRLLDTVADLDAAWLTDVIRQAGFADADVRSFSVRPIGAGNVSDTVRVAMEFAGPTEAPSSVVCKFRCSEPQAHAHGVGSGSYFREVHSYAALQNMGADSCRTPHAFWIAGGAENVNLVLEDLTGSARSGDQVTGCSPADAAAVVTQLARLHRATFPLMRAHAPDWALTMAGSAEYWADAITRALPVIRQHSSHRLSAADWAVLEHACAVAPAWYKLPMLRGALTHGDPRVDNILFVPEADGVEAVIIDWQMTGWRNPMHDVGYFLSGSVTVEDRRQHERALLGLYLDVFGRDRGYCVDAVLGDYRVQLLSGLMTTVGAYALLPITAPVEQLLAVLLRRNLEAAMDWDALGAITATDA
ncbi:MAG: aminoglycoside phosphotransferase family protein [Pseudomonadota bacterium]